MRPLLMLAAFVALSCAQRVQSAAFPQIEGAIQARTARDEAAALPVVLWHGMGDSCCGAGSMGALKTLIEDELGVFVHSVATGDGEYKDIWSSFMGNVNAQVEQVCADLKALDELAGGFNAVGFSQGGQFMRAVVERCGHELPPLHSLITIGGQHQGVMNAPGCTQGTAPGSWAAKACSVMQTLLARGAYAPWVRENVVQAQYFKDPGALDLYLANSIFLPDINNERPEKNRRYARNLAAVGRLVLYVFEDDTTVVPRESAWFSFFNGTDLIPLRDQAIYQEDWIGLKALDERGALFMESAPGEHMQFTLPWFRKAIVDRWLSQPPPEPTAASRR